MFVGFQSMIILGPYDMAFDIVVVFGLDFDFFFKSHSTYCACFAGL
jgi:hypothetical protein